MESGIKTAVMFGAVIAVAVAGISIGLSTLDAPVEQMPRVGETTAADRAGAPLAPAIDKSRFKQAPDLVGIANYINTTPEDLELAMSDSVVMYDIWTYSCINCIRTLPHITAWDDKYADQGLLIIGVHSPEFEFEKDLENVRAAVEKYGIEYPVVLDNDKDTWKAFENRYWPRKYIADHEGYIRYDHIGEGAYEETERVIQRLLEERAASLGVQTALAGELVDLDAFEHTRSRTPELYFGYYFAQGRNQLGSPEGFSPRSEVTYTIPESLSRDYFYLSGTWENLRDGMKLVSDSGQIILPYRAKEVNIVAGGDAELNVTLVPGGGTLPEQHWGDDVAETRGSGEAQTAVVRVGEHDLYNLIQSDEAGTHYLRIEVNDPGFEMFTFTFG